MMLPDKHYIRGWRLASQKGSQKIRLQLQTHEENLMSISFFIHWQFNYLMIMHRLLL